MKMNIMFDEQQAMMMALDICGNHVMCLDLKDNIAGTTTIRDRASLNGTICMDAQWLNMKTASPSTLSLP